MNSKILLTVDNNQLSQLNSIMKKNHISRTALIRQAISEFLIKQTPTKEHELLKFAGSWNNDDIDGLEFQHKIRNEWE
jgi:metal-responsive CopG/Arc/MetJ family transcriptional regulator